MSEWEQQATESGEAFAAFRRFRDLGEGRTLVQAYRAHVEAHKGPTKGPIAVPGSWKRWSAQHNWRGRAEAHDRALQRAETAGRERAAETAGQDWYTRQQNLREREWQLSQLMMERAMNMLSGDAEERDDAARPADAARLAETASRLGRLSTGLVTERQQVTRLAKPVTEMSDAELEELAVDAQPSRATRH